MKLGEAYSLRYHLNEAGIPWEAVTPDGQSAGTQRSNTSILMAFCADRPDAMETRVAGVVVADVTAAKTAMGLQGLIEKATEPPPARRRPGKNPHPYDPQARQNAIELLVPYLAAGPRDAKDVLKAGEAKGIKPHTLRRAGKQIGVIVEPVRQDGRVRGWTWRLGGIKWVPQPKVADNPPDRSAERNEPEQTPKGFNRPLFYRRERF
jgi:hypothetical protein